MNFELIFKGVYTSKLMPTPQRIFWPWEMSLTDVTAVSLSSRTSGKTDELPEFPSFLPTMTICKLLPNNQPFSITPRTILLISKLVSCCCLIAINHWYRAAQDLMPASSGPLSCVLSLFLCLLCTPTAFGRKEVQQQAWYQNFPGIYSCSEIPLARLFVNILLASTGAAQVPLVFMGTLWPAW